MVENKIYELFPALFRDYRNEDFRSLLLFVVWTTIKENPGITENKLKWTLTQNYAFSDADINLALSSLVNSQMFNSVSRFEHTHRQSGRTIVHLRPKKSRLPEMHNVEKLLIKTNPNLMYLKAS